MCDRVIIHNERDDNIVTCKTQKELMEQMKNGLYFFPPLTYADWSNPVFSVGFYLSMGAKEGKKWIPAIDQPNDLNLIDWHGYSPGSCLCPVDLERTAIENGYVYSKIDPEGEFDPFDTHFYKLGVIEKESFWDVFLE